MKAYQMQKGNILSWALFLESPPLSEVLMTPSLQNHK